MALQKTYTYRGIEIVNAYHRINYVKGYKLNGIYYMSFEVVVCKNSESEPLEQIPVTHVTEYNLTSIDNAIIQMYNYLKTRPEYSGAQDV